MCLSRSASCCIITALVGEDVTLLCHLEPAADVEFEIVVWEKPDLEHRSVHEWHAGHVHNMNKAPTYIYI